MNSAQHHWWRQAQSDFEMFNVLRRNSAAECHLLHYLQMATEKLSKAYLWRTGKAPPKTHTGFVRFMKALLDRPSKDLKWMVKLFGFDRPEDLYNWVSTGQIQTLAYELQNMAPAEAGNG